MGTPAGRPELRFSGFYRQYHTVELEGLFLWGVEFESNGKKKTVPWFVKAKLREPRDRTVGFVNALLYNGLESVEKYMKEIVEEGEKGQTQSGRRVQALNPQFNPDIPETFPLSDDDSGYNRRMINTDEPLMEPCENLKLVEWPCIEHLNAWNLEALVAQEMERMRPCGTRV